MTNQQETTGAEAQKVRPRNPDHRLGITIDELRSKYRYEPLTGRIIFLTGPLTDWRAGTTGVDGYRRIYISGHQISSGPVCWALQTGAWPAHEIDHKNRDKLDDRWENLREATRSQNLENRQYGVSGEKYVYTNNLRWRAQVRKVSLGTYATVAEAASAVRNYLGEKL